jgi:hypothetical protein
MLQASAASNASIEPNVLGTGPCKLLLILEQTTLIDWLSEYIMQGCLMWLFSYHGIMSDITVW